MPPFGFRPRKKRSVTFQELRRRVVSTRRCHGCDVSRDLFFGHRVTFNRQIWRGTIAEKQGCYQAECGTTATNEVLAHSPEFIYETSLSFDHCGFYCRSKAAQTRFRAMAGQ